MNTIELETTIDQDGMITLRDLPFHVGDRVKITIVEQTSSATKYPPYSLRKQSDRPGNPYPLHGTDYKYIDPTGPVAEDDWEALK